MVLLNHIMITLHWSIKFDLIYELPISHRHIFNSKQISVRNPLTNILYAIDILMCKICYDYCGLQSEDYLYRIFSNRLKCFFVKNVLITI